MICHYLIDNRVVSRAAHRLEKEQAEKSNRARGAGGKD